jgi:hypothetical protein
VRVNDLFEIICHLMRGEKQQVISTCYQTDHPTSINASGLDLPRKEVIHPHLPVRIPCYDLTPIISPTLGRGKAQTLGVGDFHGLTGGVYKTRERIHGNVLTHRY